jgi:hypothetical protein
MTLGLRDEMVPGIVCLEGWDGPCFFVWFEG